MTWKTYLIAAIVACVAVPAMAQGRGMEGADANGDGIVSRAEARAAREVLFSRLDGDSNGYLTAEERRRGEARAQRRAMANRADSDGDGRISRAEFMNQPMRAFDRFDADNSDSLDANEMQAMRSAMQRFGG